VEKREKVTTPVYSLFPERLAGFQVKGNVKRGQSINGGEKKKGGFDYIQTNRRPLVAADELSVEESLEGERPTGERSIEAAKTGQLSN